MTLLTAQLLTFFQTNDIEISQHQRPSSLHCCTEHPGHFASLVVASWSIEGVLLGEYGIQKLYSNNQCLNVFNINKSNNKSLNLQRLGPLPRKRNMHIVCIVCHDIFSYTFLTWQRTNSFPTWSQLYDYASLVCVSSVCVCVSWRRETMYASVFFPGKCHIGSPWGAFQIGQRLVSRSFLQIYSNLLIGVEWVYPFKVLESCRTLKQDIATNLYTKGLQHLLRTKN